MTTAAHYFPSISLGVFERQLPSDSLLRVQCSFLVNIRWVDAVDGNVLSLAGRRIPITRNRRQELGRHVRLIG